MLNEIFHDSFENFEIYKDLYGKPFKRNWVPCWRIWDSVRQEKNEPHLKLRRLLSNYACICSGALVRAKRAAEHHGKKIW